MHACFLLLPGDFFQVNPFILPALVTYVIDEASEGGSQHLVDAYCGSGLFSLSAAAHFSSVVGIEVSPSAVMAAQKNALTNGIHNVEFICGKVEALFVGVKDAQTVMASETTVIIDPSRKGCDISFLDQLIEFSPRKIVYVSCNPATQATDALVLTTNGYVISRVTPFDMFPQTKHIENVLTFEKI
jgi:23S rRNA (uracil-5-)-methyltransferase RumA